jgi:hypothetical protein
MKKAGTNGRTNQTHASKQKTKHGNAYLLDNNHSTSAVFFTPVCLHEDANQITWQYTYIIKKIIFRFRSL